MKRIIAITLAALPLALASCGATDTAPPASPETVTVTTSAKDQQEDTLRRLNAAVPALQTTQDNLRRECVFAIMDELPSAYSDMDIPETLDFTDSPGREDANGVLKQVFQAGGDFRWVDTAGTWHDATYICSVYAEDRAISDATAIVI